MSSPKYYEGACCTVHAMLIDHSERNICREHAVENRANVTLLEGKLQLWHHSIGSTFPASKSNNKTIQELIWEPISDPRQLAKSLPNKLCS
jgi:hypothetical protein